MTAFVLLRRSLRYYWRTHLGVVLGAALGSLVLTGALLVGDSVQATLRRQAEERTGRVQGALLAGERFVRSALATELGGETAPVLLVRGSVARPDGQARLNQVQVLGVTPEFWALAPSRPGGEPAALTGAQVRVNRRTAEHLGLKGGETLIVRIEKPSTFSKDAPLSGEQNETVALRVQVQGIAEAEVLGNFSLQANQVPPFTVFLPLELLQERLEVKGGANLLLSGALGREALRQRVLEKWQLADANLEPRPLPQGGLDLRTSRVFLDPPVVAQAPPGVPALTYLVNEIRQGEKGVPYSMATAVDTQAAGFLPQPLLAGEAAINQWLADDLGAAVGSRITLKYFVMGERRQLQEQEGEYTIKAILPMETPGLDTTWMPDFPGLSDKANCRDWDPGFELESGRIRDQDEAYWKKYRGTPKVLLALEDGQQRWGNRWGRTTTLRYPASMRVEQLATTLRAGLSPEALGMSFAAIREQALAATQAPVSFGELFVSFSFFLLVAAAVLTALLFVFSLEQRNDEAGLLLALGWPAYRVRRLLLAEGAVLALLGSVLGAGLAVLYTTLVLRALASVWRGAVGAVEFHFAAAPATFAIGAVSSVLIALGAMWLASRRQLRTSAGALLASAGLFQPVAAGARRRPWSLLVALLATVAAVAILAATPHGGAETFFSAGGLLLVAGIAGGLAWLRQVARRAGEGMSAATLAQRNVARRPGRSVATIGVLASGVFMVVAVNAFRQAPQHDARERASGTGGFALVGESALPIYDDFNTPKGREALGLPQKPAVAVVPMRVKEGDDASCLNLNRALQPRLLGVNPYQLAERGAFRFQQEGANWAVLYKSDDAVPAVADAATLEWALQKKVGETLDYQDERGATFRVRIVASLAGSILQGSLLIPESRFVEKYPGAGGYRFFLLDHSEQEGDVAAIFSRALADRGFEVTPAARRLAEFQAVENTYLSIFQALGGLGLLLGSVGLAIVVGRNVLERRQEFALMEAVGFRTAQLRGLVMREHVWLIALGLVIGVLSALVGVWPSVWDRRQGFPYRLMGVLVVLLLAGAVFWTWAATRLALRREQLGALRQE